MKYKSVLIIGDGIAANTVALELLPLGLNIEILSDKASSFANGFSHVFYNTMLNELGVLQNGHQKGFRIYLKRTILQKYTKACFTISELRSALKQRLASVEVSIRHGYRVEHVELNNHLIKSITFTNGQIHSIPKDLLVIDCMGRTTPFHQILPISKIRSNICYIVAQQKPNFDIRSLTSPYNTFIDHDHFSTMIYTANRDNDHLTLFTLANNVDLIKKYKTEENFYSLFKNIYGTERIGNLLSGPKIFMRPELYNIYSQSHSQLPRNYVAIGDAACSTLPVFGAGTLLAWKSARHLKEAMMRGLTSQNIDSLWLNINSALSSCYNDSLNYKYQKADKQNTLRQSLLKSFLPNKIRQLRSIKKGSYE
ncbi:hypothetical protein N8755_04700 [Alphaproteobacteria bacterium]|nr:hypothetical protein [Alphaproteobacteria bacterium]